MKILIDMQGAQTESRYRGIGRYTSSLVKAIIQNRGDHEVIVALSSLFPETIQPIRNFLFGALPQENIIVWSAPGPTFEADPSNKLRRDCAELLYEEFCALHKPDVLLITSLFEGLGDDAISSIGKLNTPIPTACILYDLIPLVSPDQHFSNNPIHQRFYKNKLISLKKCSCLLAISESSRQEALANLDFADDCVVNISGAADELSHPSMLNKKEVNLLMEKLCITQPYVMYTGGADHRKNLHRLIEAFSKIPPSVLAKHQLILVGRMPIDCIDSFRWTAKKCGLKDSKIIFTGYVSDEELVVLYKHCKSFIFPSLHEGFGLPSLEAMAYGVPVIAANATSLPEVVGNSELLFDPYSIESITQKLLQSLEDESFRNRAIKHAAKQVKLFSWEKSARAALLAMEKISNKWYEQKKYRDNFVKLNRATVIGALSRTKLSKGAADGYLRELANSIALNEPRIGDIQLLLDVSTIVHSDAKSGIQRVVRSLLKELLCDPPSGYVVRPIFLDGSIYRYAPTSEFGLDLELDLGAQPPTSYWAGDVYLALDLNMHLVSVMHGIHEFMRSRGVSLNFIVYDLLLISNPEWWHPPNPQLYLKWLNSICSLADNLICISDSVRKELDLWIEQNQAFQVTGLPKLKYFHLGADIESSEPSVGMPKDSVSILEQLHGAISFLMVGTIEPRKGHLQVLEAFELIWKDDLSSRLTLVIVGKEGWLVDKLVEKIKNHEELGRRLFWLEGISDEFLDLVYENSDCLIAASYGEGFGLPLIEASHRRLPIIARDIPVFREVGDGYIHFFNGLDPFCLRNTIEKWVSLYKQGGHLISDNMPRLTWSQSAKRLIRCIDELHINNHILGKQQTKLSVF
jgi:glycosyltransferase involved in cell wall biosynthesis